MRQIIKVSLLAVGLAGCAFGPSKLEPLNQLEGQPVERFFDALGYPDRQEVVADKTVYHWGTDQPTGPSCTVKVVANSNGIAEDWESYGNAYGCERYAKGVREATSK